MLATKSDHTIHVSTTGTDGESTVVSGSAPTVGFEVRSDIVVDVSTVSGSEIPDSVSGRIRSLI
jgi:hypothetical protein